MSLVQPASRSNPHRPERGFISVIEGGASEAGGGQARLEQQPAEDPEAPFALTPHSYQTALSLLECAARALEMLYDRREQLEASLDSVSKQAEGAVSAAQAKVLEWQKLSAGLKTEVQDLERQLGAMRQRAELAEMQVEGERARADAAERKAEDAVLLSEGFYSRIVAAFGRGSRSHKAILVTLDESQGA